MTNTVYNALPHLEQNLCDLSTLLPQFLQYEEPNNTRFCSSNSPSEIAPKSSKFLSYKVIEKEPKTANSYRLLKIPEVIAEEIEKRRKRKESDKQKYGDDYLDSDYVSCQENGMPHSTAAMNGALTKLCARNGLPHITVHGLRHMYATILVEQEVPLMKISALLGHASVNTTYEYYCDVMDENEQIITFMNNTFVPGGVAC